MNQNLFLIKYLISQCLKLSPYFSPIHSGKLIIIFSNLSGVGRNKEVVPASRLYIACEDAAGGRSFIAFSHSSWNNKMYHFDGGL